MPNVRGRPRSPIIDEAVSRAVLALLRDRGYAALSIEQVASAAGVAKTAIYRRWASKPEMVFALAVHGEAIKPPADQGSLDEDLGALTERVVALLSAPAARQALPGLLTDLRENPVLAQRFHESFIDAERRLIEALLDRAVHRGELARMPQAPDVHAQLLGMAFAWIFLMAEEPPADLPNRIATSVQAYLTR